MDGRVLPLLLWLPAAASPGFTACVPSHFGPDCAGVCACAEYEDCDDGVTGTGKCYCGFGREAECGIPSRLVPPPATPHPPCSTDADGGMRCRLDEVVLRPISSWLRLDTDTRRAPRRISNATLVPVLPTPLQAMHLRLLASDPAVAKLLGLDPSSWLDARGRTEFTKIFSGRKLFPGSVPYSHVYGGHQFGSWAGQLGDGRAISLGELHGFEISLKGSGKTPLSRAGDGRAVLQSLCREFLGGAALVALGVPSIRALAVIGTDDPRDAILRDEWYTGEVAHKRAGVLVRVAPTFVRFGSFQLAAKRQGVAGIVELAQFVLRKLALLETQDDASAAYVHRAQLYGGVESVDPNTMSLCFFSARSEPSCAATAATELEPEPILRCLLQRVVERCAALVAAWTATGFAHGVMNTDNMSILCLSLDLNVYGFMERYNEAFVPNKVDDEGRYAFGRQADIMRWNLMRLASALGGTSYPEDHESDASSWSKAGRLAGMVGMNGGWLSARAREAELNAFDGLYDSCLQARRRLRLGLPPNVGVYRGGNDKHRKQDLDTMGVAVAKWVDFLASSGADVSRAHRALGSIPLDYPIARHSIEEEVTVKAKQADVPTDALVERDPMVLSAVHHVAVAAGVSADWLEENQQQCVKAIGGVITAAKTAIRHSLQAAQCHEFTDDELLAMWQRHIVAMNPSLVLRTSALREVTTFAAEDLKHGADALHAMLEEVKHPYGAPVAMQSRTRDSDRCVDDTTCTKDMGSLVAEQLVNQFVEDMHGLPQVSASGEPPQTSCGGQ